MARLLFWRAPSVKLRCIWALQATTLSDSPLHPGLLAEPRLTQFLPGYLVAAQRKVSVSSEGREIAGLRRVLGARAAAAQRVRRAAGARHLPREHPARLPLHDGPAGGRRPRPTPRRARKTYFERTLQLFNLHGVEPVLVIMPYHPTALAAFRAVGLGRQGGGVQDLPREPARHVPLPPAGLHRPRVVPRRRRTRSTTARTSPPPMRAASSRRPSRTRRQAFR